MIKRYMILICLNDLISDINIDHLVTVASVGFLIASYYFPFIMNKYLGGDNLRFLLIILFLLQLSPTNFIRQWVLPAKVITVVFDLPNGGFMFPSFLLYL